MTKPFYVAHLCDDGSLDTDNIAGHDSYRRAREAAEIDAKRYSQRKIVILETRETIWSEPAIHDDLPTVVEPN